MHDPSLEQQVEGLSGDDLTAGKYAASVRRETSEYEQRADDQLSQLRAQLEATGAERDTLAAQLAKSAAELNDIKVRTALLRQRARELDDLKSSAAYRVLERYRGVVERVLPADSRRRARYQRATGHLRRSSSDDRVLGSIAVSTTPLVSIVIPAYGHWQITRNCLIAIAEASEMTPYEVVVVDDASPDHTTERLAAVPGVRVISLDRNVGYLRACNVGIAHSRGNYILLLNNDTVPQPGYIDSLVDRMESDLTIGVVGSKLIYADGSLQEAGGIIFADGSGLNYGRGADPENPAFNFTRDVDYCSGAALLVRRSLLDLLGGFDERFAPAYYEDTDLCFEARAHGYRVVYEPRSVVVHLEGASHGQDVSAGLKRYQEINRRQFAEKWANELRDQLPPDAANVELAKQRCGNGAVLVVDHTVPTYDRDSGSMRMYRILGMLRQLGYTVLFYPACLDLTEPYTAAVMRLGVEVVGPPWALDERVTEIRDRLVAVVLSRRDTAWSVLDTIRRAAPAAPILFDTVDLHFLREEREAELANDSEALRLARYGREKELALVRLADATLVVAEDELELLGALEPAARLALLPTVHDATPTVTELSARTGLVFVGNFHHRPNVDGIVWFVEEIFPQIREELPGTDLRVVGGGAPAAVQSLQAADVHVLGWVEDLRSIYESARAVIAPLRYGAGMKGKVTEALAHGVPVVTTTIGVEGLPAAIRALALVADEPTEFAKSVVEVCRDPALWLRLHTSSPNCVSTFYGTDVVTRRLAHVLQEFGRPVAVPGH